MRTLKVETSRGLTEIILHAYEDAVAEKLIYPKGKGLPYNVKYPYLLAANYNLSNELNMLAQTCVDINGRDFIVVKRDNFASIYQKEKLK